MRSVAVAGANRRVFAFLLFAAVALVAPHASAQSQNSDALAQRLGPNSPLREQPYAEYVRRAGIYANLCDLENYSRTVAALRELLRNAIANTGGQTEANTGLNFGPLFYVRRGAPVTDPLTKAPVRVAGSEIAGLRDAVGRMEAYESELAQNCAERNRAEIRADRTGVRSPQARDDLRVEGLPPRPADPRAAANAALADIEARLAPLVRICARQTYVDRVRGAIADAQAQRDRYATALRSWERDLATLGRETPGAGASQQARDAHAVRLARASRTVETLRRLIEQKDIEIPLLRGLLLTANERFAHCNRDQIAAGDEAARAEEGASLFLILRGDLSETIRAAIDDCDEAATARAFDAAIAQVPQTFANSPAAARLPAAERERRIAEAQRGLENRKRAVLADMARRCRPRGADLAAPASPGSPGGVTIEPMILFGSRTNRAEGGYSSTGGQPPGAGRGERSDANACGALQGWVSVGAFEDLAKRLGGNVVVLGKTEVGLRFGVCHLGNGEKIVFKELRHPGTDGTVGLTERERTEIKLYLMLRQTFLVDIGGLFGRGTAFLPGDQFASTELAQGAAATRAPNYWPVALYVGGGPSYVSSTIEIVSNQTGAGGAVETTRERKSDTAWGLVIGAQTALCRRCVLGSPIMIGVEGGWMWLPDRTVNVRSSAFGFVETGRVTNRSSTRVMVTMSVPFRVFD